MCLKGEKIYLYGAGINSFGVIKYLGKENVVAVIDGNREKVGMEIEEIPIVDIEYYMDHNRNEKIIISAFQKSSEIECYLKELGINNYLVAPYIQAGFPSIEEIAAHMVDRSVKKIVIADNNVVSYLLVRYLQSSKIPIEVVGGIEENIIVKENELPILSMNDIVNDVYFFCIEENLYTSDKKNKISIVEDMRNKFFCCNENILQFKDKFSGKRCFIIGAGPSLKMEDLDVLARNKEICFASNKIYLAFPKTIWRPDFYMVCDFNVFRSCYDEIKKLNGFPVFIENFYNGVGLEEIPGVFKLNSIHQKNNFLFSENVDKYVYSGLTVTYNILQLAVYMGFTEIYLLGIDFSYNGISESKGNYFCEDYSKNTKTKGIFYSEENLKAYEAAEIMSYRRGIKIFNSTRGGKLEVFERKDFDTLFEKGEE